MWRQASLLNFNWANRHEPASVLVFAFFHDNLLWVKHPQRGWEVPGGKIEWGETPEAAAVREVFEEAGAIVKDLQWIGEYVIEVEGVATYKWTYRAKLWDIGARPIDSEIVDTCFFHPAILPSQLQRRTDISPIMKDSMYPMFWAIMQQ